MTNVIETLKSLSIGKVNVTVTLVADYHPDLSYLGEYSKEPAEGAIETGRTGPEYFIYFNPQPGMEEYAQQDYERMEAYTRDEWMMTGVCVTIKADGRILGDTSLWGIEYAYKVEDYHRETMFDMFGEAMHEARAYLASIPKSKSEQRFEAALQKIATAPKASFNKVATAYQNIAIEALHGKPIEEPEQPETIVIFRKWRDSGEILALFPEGGMSYQHIGQHSAANYHHMVGGPTRLTVPATAEEYADLLEELVAVGYTNLKIQKRWMRRKSR